MTPPGLLRPFDAARAWDAAARVPWRLMHAGTAVEVGSVARRDLDALLALAPELAQPDGGLLLDLPDAAARSARLEQINAGLRAAGLIRAWRNETYAVVTALGAAPLACIERACSRFWGTLTFGAHCNGYRRGPDGRPSHLWIARRSPHKPTDPGMLDNLVGGGVPHGQSPFETLVREGWEEAGLSPAQMRAATPGRIYRLVRDIPEGLQVEDLHVHDLELVPGLEPRNQDGEVAEFRCLPLAEVLAQLAAGALTVDAALATLDFLLRHQLLPQPAQAELAARAQALHADRSAG
ncbi:MAG: hypothetical protein RJA44_2214 [Pseudomonadota bacterium]|jgi:8-oxo-dGTP pyrophosphatase MutT (NUDIX family)